jgi:Lon protease-like protein
MALRGGRPLSLADLPSTIPVFPLAGVLLLPRGSLPLNIFEPRYLAMTEDALATTDRLIGMIQPTEPERGDKPPSLYTVGCAGRIASFSETDDGRYLITLSGVCRFGVSEEVATMRGYRRVVPDFARYGMSADWNAITDSPDDRLVTTLSMFCPFEPQEKQALLECATLAERSATLVALLEMGTRGNTGEGAKH